MIAAAVIIGGIVLYSLGKVGMSTMTLPIDTIQLMLMMNELETYPLPPKYIIYLDEFDKILSFDFYE